ncbi:MAG: hypothetical protein HFJ34_00395 [Clostridia bacterium]|nr:hypothetical protein [Clostridia bacterium]
MKKRAKLRKKENTNKGITLIALVITIIVLLILAGITIATLTGENGILNKANTAKEKTQEETAKEKVEIAVMGSYGTDGKLNYEELKENLDKVDGIIGVPNNITQESFPLEVNVDGYKVIIEKNGTITIEKAGNIPLTIEQAKEEGKVLDENNPVTITDKYNNKIVIPEGFKIAEDSAEDVTGGIVIEDESNLETKGSQFVWIPIGEINGADEVTKTINLNRYSFATDGTPTAQGENIIQNDYQELKSSTYGNMTAKDIDEFKSSVLKNGGYYIGRYEARTPTKRTAITDDSGLNKVTIKKDDYVYDFVQQAQAGKLSQEMYSGKKFTSDLANSYAWDTAVVFLQLFDDRIDKTIPYSRRKTLNYGYADKGTNHLENLNQQDKICNIWDMASNKFEWTTETAKVSNSPCTARGGNAVTTSDMYTSGYWKYSLSYSGCGDHSFRIILYI